jgi:nucleotide-binding universal stress UspA family protein
MLAIGTILHPTDFSKEAGYAFNVACALARDSRARLVVLHVERPPLMTLGGTAGVPPLPTEYDRQQLLDELHLLQPTVPDIVMEHRLEHGEPAPVILAVAKQIGADLIVIGTHGRTGLRRLLMGSVAEQVVRKASCPVLTVKNPMAAELEVMAAAEATAPA